MIAGALALWLLVGIGVPQLFRINPRADRPCSVITALPGTKATKCVAFRAALFGT